MSKNALNSSEMPFSNEGIVSIPALSTNKSAKLASKEAFFVSDKKTVPKIVPTEKPYRKRFLRDTKPYKLPKIIRGKDGWVVRYWYELPDRPGKFKAIPVRDGINYIHDLEERERAAQQLCSDISYALEKRNYNPFEDELVIAKSIQKENKEIIEKERLMLLSAALDWFLSTKKEKNRSEKTLNGYRYTISSFIEWCEARDLTRINSPTIEDIEKYLSEQLENEEWSPRTYNNNISILTTFFNYLVAKRKMPINPIGAGMIERITNKAEKNKYYDQETLDKILPEVKRKPVLRRRIMWAYYTCARGTELRQLRIRDIDLNVKKITITAEIGKTGGSVGKRSIPICQELYDIIIEEKLKDLPGDWYVFGFKGIPGVKAAGSYYFSDMYYEIKKKLNIDFGYSIYSFKHTRVVDLLIAGFDPIKVMYITGHTDWASFQKYIRELGAVMDKLLIGNTLKLNL